MRHARLVGGAFRRHSKQVLRRLEFLRVVEVLGERASGETRQPCARDQSSDYLHHTLPPYADYSALRGALAPLASAAPAPRHERHRGDQNETLRRFLEGVRPAEAG